MFPAILGSLAVYAAAAGLVCWAADRWVLPVSRRMAAALAMLPLLFTGRALLTGRVFAPIDILYDGHPFRFLRGDYGIGGARTPLLSDVVSSMIPWHQAVRDAVLDGRFPLWNRFILAGEPLLAVQQHAALHPGSWIALLLPAPQAWTFLMTFRLLIALLAAYLFLREIGCGEAPSVLGAAAWGFSDFIVFWVGYPVTNALGPFPLLLLGLGRLARDADRRAAGLTAAALVLIITAGHPESVLFAVTGAGVYFLFRLGAADKQRRVKAVLLSVAAGAAALGLTAVQLLPLMEALPQTWEHFFRSSWYSGVKKSATLTDSARRGLTVLVPYAYGQSGYTSLWRDFGAPAVYAGSILFPLALTGALSRNRQRRALVAMGLLGLAVWARLAIVTDGLALLPLFEIGILDYLVFLAVFALAALAALGAERLSRGEGRGVFLAGAAAVAFAIPTIFLFRRTGLEVLGMTPEFARVRLSWALGPLVAAGALVLYLRAPNRLRYLAPALVGVLLAVRTVEAGSVYPTYSAAAFYPRIEALDAVPRDAAYRFTARGYVFVPNASAMYGLEDVRGYESMTLRSFHETFPLWCVKQPVWFNRVDDLTKPFLSFLNVRYALVSPSQEAPPGWRRIARGRGADLLENSRPLPRAFAPAAILHEPDPARRLEALRAVTDFAGIGVVDEPPAGESTTPNGPARVRIIAYRPQSMDLEIEAERESVIGTSVTAWEGWKARLDGRPIARLSYNHAFLGFRVPAGRHVLELAYRPDGFAAGAAASLATAALLLAASRRGRNR